MKSVDVEKIKELPGKRIQNDETFRFRCHERLSCFNLCCRNLNLFLYPYDVLRLRKNLGISSDEFIDTYVDVVLRPNSYFPEVLLRMSDNEEKTCPFLSAEGCTVYPDRPDTCRTFPVEHGILYDASGQKTELVHFFRPPDFCEGQFETDEMTITSWGTKGPSGQKGKMAFMSAYNIDQFRDFVFKSSFLKRYKVKSGILKKMKRSDVELLKFGFTWIRFFVWGIKTNQISLKK